MTKTREFFTEGQDLDFLVYYCTRKCTQKLILHKYHLDYYLLSFWIDSDITLI